MKIQTNVLILSIITCGRKPTVRLYCNQYILKKSFLILKGYTFKFAATVYQFLIKGTFLMKYVSSNYSNKVFLPLALIRDAISDNYLDSLCYYVWMKKIHQKPIIYNYSLRKISAAIGCSPTTVKTHIAILKGLELIEFSAGNLIIKSTRKLFANKKQLMVPISVSYNKSDQRDLLRFAVIKRNLHSQSRKFQQKNDALNYHKGLSTTYADIKRGRKLTKKDYPNAIALESSMQSVLTLSNKKFGAICNRSQSTGIKLQKSFNKLNLIVSSARTKLIEAKKHTRREFFNLELGSSHFISKAGQIYKRLTNMIEITNVNSSIQIIGQ